MVQIIWKRIWQCEPRVGLLTNYPKFSQKYRVVRCSIIIIVVRAASVVIWFIRNTAHYICILPNAKYKKTEIVVDNEISIELYVLSLIIRSNWVRFFFNWDIIDIECCVNLRCKMHWFHPFIYCNMIAIVASTKHLHHIT